MTMRGVRAGGTSTVTSALLGHAARGPAVPRRVLRPHHAGPVERPAAVMADRLGELTAAGVAIWLDDLSRARLASGSLADLVRDARRGGDDEPDDLRQGDHRQRPLRPADPRPRRPGRRGRARRCACSPPPTCAGPATCCARSTTPPTASTAGCPSRSTPGSRTTPSRPIAEARAAVVAGRPAQPVHQDPGDDAGPARDHRLPGRGDQHQRHPDLLPGPLRRGDGRLPRRHRASPGRGPRPDPDWPRWPRSSSAASTPRSTSAWTRSARAEAKALRGAAAIANARLAFQHYERGLHLRPLARPRPGRGPAAAAAVGLDRR